MCMCGVEHLHRMKSLLTLTERLPRSIVLSIIRASSVAWRRRRPGARVLPAVAATRAKADVQLIAWRFLQVVGLFLKSRCARAHIAVIMSTEIMPTAMTTAGLCCGVLQPSTFICSWMWDCMRVII